jgi:hypothetical protein
MQFRITKGVFAVLTTGSLLLAGGGDDEPGKKPTPRDTNVETLARLGNEPGSRAVEVSAKSGDGITIKAGDDFSLNLSNQFQALWRYAASDAGIDTNTFRMRRVRTKLSGNVYGEDKKFFVLLDWTKTSVLQDAWFDWEFWQSQTDEDIVSLRVGQMKPRHGRQFETSSSKLEMTERSIASNTFVFNRIVGARLQGSHIEDGKLNWAAGVFNGDPAGASSALEGGNGAANPDNELNYVFDISFDPLGQMPLSEGDLEQTEELHGSVGAGVVVGNHKLALTPGSGDIETVSININTAWKVQGFHAFGEIFLRSDDQDGGAEADSTGWTVQGSYTLPPPEEKGLQWGFAARYSMVELDDVPVLLTGTPLTTGSGDVSEIEGTVSAYYHAHKLKTQIGYRHQTVDPDAGGDIDNDFIDVLFTAIF